MSNDLLNANHPVLEIFHDSVRFVVRKIADTRPISIHSKNSRRLLLASCPPVPTDEQSRKASVRSFHSPLISVMQSVKEIVDELKNDGLVTCEKM